ncbi:MAG: hypothetical protein IKP49_07075 [Treponema sp.]|nr:hypothetical protein [Treponema sp.]
MDMTELSQNATKAIADAVQMRAEIRKLIEEKAESNKDKAEILEFMEDYATDDDRNHVEDHLSYHLENLLEEFSALAIKDKAGLGKAFSLLDEKSRRHVLAKLLEEGRDKEFEILRYISFFFNDIQQLDDRSTQRVLREATQDDLVYALKTSEFKTRRKIFLNCSKRCSEELLKEIENTIDADDEKVTNAKEKIIQIMAKLKENGEILWPYNDKGDFYY